MGNEIRWDPILEEWVIIAVNLTLKPVADNIDMEKKEFNSNPFCSDISDNSENWIVKKLPINYPTLAENRDIVFKNEEIIESFYKKRPSKCIGEIFLFNHNHGNNLGDLDLHNINALISLWKARFNECMKDPDLKYTFIFENTMKFDSSSLSHPHSQLFSFPFIPPKIIRECDSAKKYWDQENTCLFCKIINVEQSVVKRIIEENDDFIAFIPYFAKWPFETHIFPKDHTPNILGINQSKQLNFARTIKGVVKRLNGIFGCKMPYLMNHHNAPHNDGEYEYFHYHIEIYPQYRAKDRIKYFGGVELGANTIINSTNPSENARILRDIRIKID